MVLMGPDSYEMLKPGFGTNETVASLFWWHTHSYCWIECKCVKIGIKKNLKQQPCSSMSPIPPKWPRRNFNNQCLDSNATIFFSDLTWILLLNCHFSLVKYINNTKLNVYAYKKNRVTTFPSYKYWKILFHFKNF